MSFEFSVRATINPETLPRVIGQLARRALIPADLSAELCDDEMRIRFQTLDVPDHVARIVSASIASQVLVHEVVMRPLKACGEQ